MQCGSACLAMICRYYGGKSSASDISKICVSTAMGVSINGIEYAARNLGMDVESCFVTKQVLDMVEEPIILHWNQNHFVVLYKVMLGYYPVLSGRICIAGCDIQKYNLKWWRRHCGVVMQDGVIFSESIERNIAVDDGEVDRERLVRAARIACIHDYVMGLPLKYNTRIGSDGVGLSQGQKQRILIARAVYKTPDFIFLDEATNALDAKNERSIVENLGRFYAGRTVVVVAHRLSTVKNADQIVVLDGGRVVESGSHEELTRMRGAYYCLVKNQLELGS